MTTRADRIISILNEKLSPTLLRLEDDSHKHAGHAGARPGGETHYTLHIESDAFTGLSRVQMHQLVYKLLDVELKQGLHALAIHACVPAKQD